MNRLITSTFLASVLAMLPLAAEASGDGRITAMSGQGLVHHANDAVWTPAWPGQPLMPGDAVLAQPGSHLRLSIGDADITLRPEAELDWAGQNGDLPVLRLDQGVAEIGLPPGRWNQGVTLLTPWGDAQLQQPGAYRLSLHAARQMRLAVWQGRADLPPFGLSLWPGQQASLSDQGAAVAAAPAMDEDFAAGGYYYAPSAVYAPPSAGIIIQEQRPRSQGYRMPEQHQNHGNAPAPQPRPAPQPKPQPSHPTTYDGGHVTPKVGPTPPPHPQPAPQKPEPQKPEPQKPAPSQGQHAHQEQDHGHDRRPPPNGTNGQ